MHSGHTKNPLPPFLALVSSSTLALLLLAGADRRFGSNIGCPSAKKAARILGL